MNLDLRRLRFERASPDVLGSRLSKLCRFAGATRRFYSVAEHCLLCEALGRELDPMISHRERLALLLHDAHEAFLGDIISPVKRLLGRENIALIETELDQRICREYNLELNDLRSMTVYRIDAMLLHLEGRFLIEGWSREDTLGKNVEINTATYGWFYCNLRCLQPTEAASMYVQRLYMTLIESEVADDDRI